MQASEPSPPAPAQTTQGVTPVVPTRCTFTQPASCAPTSLGQHHLQLRVVVWWIHQSESSLAATPVAGLLLGRLPARPRPAAAPRQARWRQRWQRHPWPGRAPRAGRPFMRGCLPAKRPLKRVSQYTRAACACDSGNLHRTLLQRATDVGQCRAVRSSSDHRFRHEQCVCRGMCLKNKTLKASITTN